MTLTFLFGFKLLSLFAWLVVAGVFALLTLPRRDGEDVWAAGRLPPGWCLPCPPEVRHLTDAHAGGAVAVCVYYPTGIEKAIELIRR
jgi:hypothetical protein